MLKPVKSSTLQAENASFALIASRYNARFVDAMLQAAKVELKKARAKQVTVFRVPGAFEIPVIASRLAASNSYSALICLGVILRGETTHAAHIAESVTSALMDLQVQYGLPIVHEVLLLENQEQAKVRCLGKKHNRGSEAATTALAMAQLIESMDTE